MTAGSKFDSSRVENFLFATFSEPTLQSTKTPAQQLSQFFPYVKRAAREAYHSRSSNANVKNAWSYISTSP
jgi:hypothetical protein